MIKKDCFAYKVSKNGIERCDALVTLCCRNENCSFYKEASVYLKQLDKVKEMERLNG